MTVSNAAGLSATSDAKTYAAPIPQTIPLAPDAPQLGPTLITLQILRCRMRA